MASTLANNPSVSVASAPAPCADPAYNLLGGKEPNGHYDWAFQASSTPAGLSATGVRDVLRRSFTNVTTAHNDCGLPDNVSATHTYLGTTSLRPRCNQMDGHNVVGFKSLPFGTLAVTCYWISGNTIVEADMQINSDEDWALSQAACFHQILLEATITHEAGHVFGLDHVGERKHGRLTMSPFVDGQCNNNESTLGLGDVKGLEHLY